jgi:hypothetical protein
MDSRNHLCLILRSATDHPAELKHHLVCTFNRLMDTLLHDRQDISDEQRAAVGVTAAKAIVEFASTGEHDPDTIYAYALTRASVASSSFRWHI